MINIIYIIKTFKLLLFIFLIKIFILIINNNIKFILDIDL